MSENRGVLGPWDSSRATLGGDIGDTPPALRAFPSPPQFPPISLPAVGNPRGWRTLGNAEIPFFRGVLSLKNKIQTLRENFIFKGNSFILVYFFYFLLSKKSPKSLLGDSTGRELFTYLSFLTKARLFPQNAAWLPRNF